MDAARLGSDRRQRQEAAIDAFVTATIDFVRDHQEWAIPIVLFLSFGESLAFLSLLLPATAILFAAGGMIGAAGRSFMPIWTAATVGAFLGDWVSFWISLRYKRQILTVWPLSRHPEMIVRGEAFFVRWGVYSVFVGRFFGPLRAVMPVVAGIMDMRNAPFQIANATSAVVWATGILAPGAFGVQWLKELL